MNTQQQITDWEIQHKEQITGWIIIYGEQYDTITFNLKDNTKKEFKRSSICHT